jgi:endonuclease-3 related protein
MRNKFVVKTGRRQDTTLRKKLMAIYRALLKAYGAQHWWPAKTPFEVMVGAVLTQNTAWPNVEKALANLKYRRILTPAGLDRVSESRLAAFIRPSGYYNVKAKRLKNLVGFIRDRYSGSLRKLFSRDPDELRRGLLSVNGIGPETADSILLYAANLTFFVVDAYTKRVFSRHAFIDPEADYDEVQYLVMDNLPASSRLYNEFHALIVRVGKEHCRKKIPLCKSCPLAILLPTSRRRPADANLAEVVAAGKAPSGAMGSAPQMKLKNK